MTLVKRGEKLAPISAPEYDALVQQVEDNKALSTQNASEIPAVSQAAALFHAANEAEMTAEWNRRDGLGDTPIDGKAEVIRTDFTPNQYWKWDASETSKGIYAGRDVDVKDATPTEGSTNAVQSGALFDIKTDLKQSIVTSLKTTETTESDYSNNLNFTVAIPVDLVELKKDIKYTITAQSSDSLTNGLRFYNDLDIIQTFGSGEDFAAGVSFTYIPSSDFTISARTQLTGVDVQIDIEHLETTSTEIETNKTNIALNTQDLIDLDYKVDTVLDIDTTLITDYDDTLNVSTTTLETVTSLTAGIKYTITVETSDSLPQGLDFYSSLPSLVIVKEFESTEDFVAGVSFELIPSVDTVLSARTYISGKNLDITVKHNEFDTPFNDLKTLTEEKEVLKLSDFTPFSGAFILPREFSKYSGKKVRLNIKADYTGQFTLYATVSGVLTSILNVTSTNFDVADGLNYDVDIPLNTSTISFRFYQTTSVVNNVTIYTSGVKDNNLSFGFNQWENKNIAFYGDSITAINTGDEEKPFTTYGFWHTIVGKFLNLNKVFGRGVGSQKYDFDTNGGAVTFLNTVDGTYNSRNNSYNYDNYEGNVAVPAGTTPTRGAFSSWLRIKTSFPSSIKDSIDAVVIMGATNDSIDATALSWVASDATDTEWAASTEYSTYGGDYNLNSLEGGIASTIMKFQAWMPNARIIIATPLSGRGTTGQLNMANPITEEYTKSISVRKIANIFSIPLIDVNSECGINGANRIDFITDSLHPYNEDGRKMLGTVIAGGLKKIFPRI